VRRLGLQVDPKQLRLRNVAAVVVTGTLPAFAKSGTKIDVTVSSIGNARSLAGGTLVQAVLKGPDQHAYAVAQGSVLIIGSEARGASGSVVKSGTTTAGRIPEGAIVEREVPVTFDSAEGLRLSLRAPGFGTAANVIAAIDKKLGPNTASASDGGAVLVKVPAEYQGKTVELMSVLEEIEVVTVRRARVVINERTGTVVAGGDVRLAPVALVHGSLTIVVSETPAVSQPNAAPLGRSAGQTVVVPRSSPGVQEGAGEASRSVTYLPAAPQLSDVASALGTLGLSPRELTAVLQALRSAGALEAEVLVQ
jgi:flagellar P-ring protein precursor FlgI